MTRLMIIPAAGAGSRLGAAQPKALVPVAGRPMLHHLLSRFGAVAERFVIVVAPHAESAFRASLAGRAEAVSLEQFAGLTRILHERGNL